MVSVKHVSRFANLDDNSEMDVKQIRHRNAQILAKEVGSWAELARRADTNPKYLSQIISEKGTRQVGDKLARKLEQGCGKTYGWMDQEHSDVKEGQRSAPVTHPAKPVLAWDEESPLPEGEFILIPRLDVQLSAGNGTVLYDVDEKQPHAFRADWLIKRKLRPENICLMYACGDSMEEFIQNGDTLLVDVTNRAIVDNQVYALRYGDELRVKRLFKRPDGGLRIVSDNKQYPEETASPEEVESYIDIIGRIVWRGG